MLARGKGFDNAMKELRAKDLIKKKAEKELGEYVKALSEFYDTRCMTLLEGMVAGFCVVEILTKDEGRAWLSKGRALERR